MPTVPLEQCPYVGPRPFERGEKRYLGRETEASQLLSYITSQRAFLVYAQSGAGKTSLINAGVIPLLEREHFEVLPVARVRYLGRGDVSAAQNIFVFSAIMSWTSSGIEPRSLFDKTLAEFLTRPVIDDTLPRVVIFDQFEELFTAHLERWQERRGFFEQVCDALNADPLLRVVFVMREDYIAEIDPYLSILPGRLRARFRLEQLREKAAIDSVTKPLLGTPWHFAEGVAEKLVHDLMEVRFERSGEEDFHVKAEFVELVQLQIVCESLWKKIAAAGVTEITEADLKASGNVNEALAAFYETALRQAVEIAKVREGDLRRWVESNLLTAAGTRGTVFRGKETTAGMPNKVIDLLEDLHLLRAELRGGERWYELTHDRFIEPIRESNARWLAQRAGPEKARQNYEHSAAEWSNSGKSRMRLLRHKELREAEKWKAEADTAELAISDTLAAFLDASRNAEREVARQWKLRATVAAAALVAIAAIIAAVQIRVSANKRAVAADRAGAERDEARKLVDEGEVAPGIKHFRRALSLAEQSHNGNLQISILKDLASSCSKSKDEGGEKDALQKTVTMTQRIEGKDSPDLVEPLDSLGEIFARQQETYDRAIDSYKRACDILERRYGKDCPQSADTLSRLAHVYYSNNDRLQAERVFIRVPKIWEKAQGPGSKKVFDSWEELAQLYIAEEKFDNAEEVYKRAVAIREKAFGLDSNQVAESLNSVAEFYQKRKRPTDIEKAAARIVHIVENNSGEKSRELVSPLLRVADSQRAQNKLREARQNYTRAIDIVEDASGVESFELVRPLTALADLEYDESRLDKAAEYYGQVANLREQAAEKDNETGDVLHSLNRLLEIKTTLLGADHPEFANVLIMLGKYYSAMGKMDEAIEAYGRAIVITDKLPMQDKPEIARNLIALGRLHCKRARSQAGKEAEASFEHALPCFLRAAEIRKGEPKKYVSAADLVESLNQVAMCYHDLNKFREAIAVYQQVLEAQEQGLGADHPDLAYTLTNLGRCHSALYEFDEAEPLLRRALRIRSQGFRRADDAELALNLFDLGNVYCQLGRYSRAESVLKEALSKQGENKVSKEVASTLDQLGTVYVAMGDFQTAIPKFERELAIQKQLARDGDVSADLVAQGMHNLGWNLWQAGRFMEVEPLYKKALELSEKVWGAENVDVVTQIANRGWLYYDLGRFDDAEQFANSALASREKDARNHPDYLADSLDLRAKLLMLQGKFEDAEMALNHSLQLRRDLFKEEHVQVADSLLNLANFYRDMKRFEEAELLYGKALTIRGKHLSSQSAGIAEVLNDRALLYVKQGKYSEAEPLLTRALSIREKTYRDDCPFIGRTLCALADVYAHQNQSDRAKLCYDRAVQIFKKSLPDHPDTAAALEAYASVCKSTHADDKAAQLESEASQIRAIRAQQRAEKSPEQTLSPLPRSTQADSQP
jgi:tetratricopeptide (TPR) repeat protein